ncbi:MAG: hypothetical protein GF349_04405 [Candidatus Magasanikbacteria bacterium]|nr:hypothetical protein [Candidatus Magasanikbacteria bacterium]
MKKEEFAGHLKYGFSVFSSWEIRLRDKLVPLVPSYIETYHLTLTTILWSALVIVFSFLAQNNLNWLWLVSLMIVFQYITDLLDGEIGRRRKTGLIKWGYYMDHFLDYIFLCSIMIGYSLIVGDQFKYLLLMILSLFGAFMVNSYLAFATTNKFRISYLKLGPTEARLLFIIINTLLILIGKTYMAGALPYVLILSLFGLIIVVYRTQKEIMAMDIEKMKQEYKK